MGRNVSGVDSGFYVSHHPAVGGTGLYTHLRVAGYYPTGRSTKVFSALLFRAIR